MAPARRLITVPYDSGRRREGLGKGPDAWLAAGAERRLRLAGGPVSAAEVRCPAHLGELASAFAVAREVAAGVREAWDAGASPVVLAGNCGASLGVLAGLPERTGVLWLDAHGDLQLPSTTTSGYVDGMSLSAITGRCWEALAASVPGFVPVPDERVLILGAHALDDDEVRLLAGSSIRVLSADTVRSEHTGDALTGLTRHVDRLHVHVDLDVHDVSVGRANAWTATGGLGADEVTALVRAAAEHLPLASLTLASWDPALDYHHRMRDVGLALLELAGELLSTDRPVA
ncbi:arginase family protein [Cellulomonas sp. URHE0023]|uniref:arginase family protein n=1 Tax=Cellulomonas sp. URHE0023 TaxID=1380354 RepID=UPI0004856E18|nr:arginase family protein [Cellulomonas sp. URHE0023]